MRITTSLLHKIARDTVAQRTRTDHSILAVYLSGSLVSGDPLLGGTTDIDLFIIHNDLTSPEREIERLTDEVHLDIAHQARDIYHETRALRLHPWLGEIIINCKVMYDPQHFLDFTQASVRAQFDQPEIRLQRVQSQAEHARQIWLALHDLEIEPQIPQVEQYLRAVGHAAKLQRGDPESHQQDQQQDRHTRPSRQPYRFKHSQLSFRSFHRSDCSTARRQCRRPSISR